MFARDFRAKDLAGWPQEQAHAFFLKATDIEHSFEDIDLSVLGQDLQPDQLVRHEDMARDGIAVPELQDLGIGFYGYNFLLPKGETSPMYGHPVALLVYKDFDRFEASLNDHICRCTGYVRYYQAVEEVALKTPGCVIG